MKLRETEFFQEFTAIIAGCVLLMASVAFVSIPASLAHNPGDPALTIGLTSGRHLT